MCGHSAYLSLQYLHLLWVDRRCDFGSSVSTGKYDRLIHNDTDFASYTYMAFFSRPVVAAAPSVLAGQEAINPTALYH